MTTLAHARERGRPSDAGRFLRLDDVMTTTGLGRSTIYRMVANHTFPPQVRLTARSIGWWQADVDKWMRDRLSDSPHPG